MASLESAGDAVRALHVVLGDRPSVLRSDGPCPGEAPFLAVPVIAALLAACDTIRSAVGRLKYLGYGASPMPVPLLERAIQAWPQVNLSQAYGEAELSGVATALLPDDPATGPIRNGSARWARWCQESRSR
ncbi:hypothetical protein ACFVWP_43525 [Streptomyces sp. NPDC058175]|uniref:hypothetical protein n=1 Tax=Streptomyces sp. NPDC058175 TaxID=3346367 RepID=UPI0036E5D680